MSSVKNLGHNTVLACEIFSSGCRPRLKNARAKAPYYMLRETSFEEPIMSSDKYPSIFSLQMSSNRGYCVYYRNIFRNTRGFENWGISLRFSSVFAGNIESRDVFRLIAREGKNLMDYNGRLI